MAKGKYRAVWIKSSDAEADKAPGQITARNQGRESLGYKARQGPLWALVGDALEELREVLADDRNQDAVARLTGSDASESRRSGRAGSAPAARSNLGHRRAHSHGEARGACHAYLRGIIGT